MDCFFWKALIWNILIKVIILLAALIISNFIAFDVCQHFLSLDYPIIYRNFD